jgi:CubicO group peptidase (beta-lactamase class C family)
MVRLISALLDGSAPGLAALNPIKEIQTDRPNRMTGLCWIIDGPPDQIPAITWHNGGTGGYSSFLALMPDTGRAVVALQSVAGRSQRLQRIALEMAA